MLFLLVAVNAKYIHSNPAVYSLKGFLPEQLRTHVKIAEFTINQDFEETLEEIYNEKPDAIGFSCYIWNINTVLSLIVELKKLMPEVLIWLGGPEAGHQAKKLLSEYKELTGIMIGEGEETFQELLSFYLNKEKEEKLYDIKGICLPERQTEERCALDMNRLPFLYENLEKFQNRIIYYESSRGCPFQCSYCLSSIDKSVRFRDLKTVQKELQTFLDYRVTQVKFVDRTFNCKESHACAIWEYLLSHDNGFTNFHFEIAAECMTEREMKLLSKMRAGQIQLEIGIQTANPATLSAIHRIADLSKVRYVVNTIHGFKNIHQHLDLIAGLPHEDYASFQKSFDFVFSLKPQKLQLGFLKVLHGSLMEKEADRYGIRYQSTPPYEVLSTKNLSFPEVRKLKRVEEMVELYYNSGQFSCSLKALLIWFPSSFKLFEELSRFYLRKGYFVNQPARSYRYEILRSFFCEEILTKEDGQEKEAFLNFFTECLTYDLYVREKLKTRPAFLPEQTENKLAIRKLARLYPRTAHIEAFSYPVYAPDNSKSEMKMHRDNPIFVVFDYEKRDPLTGSAETSVVFSEDFKE